MIFVFMNLNCVKVDPLHVLKLLNILIGIAVLGNIS